MYAVETQALVKRYRSTVALDGLDLAVPAGTVLGLLGPNGAGKTTAVRVLATLLRPDSGTARVGGHDVTREPGRVRELIGLTGQFAAVDEELTGREQGLVARQRGPAAPGEQPEPVRQPRGQLAQRHGPQPRAGQLDRERQPVQPAAHLSHQVEVVLGSGPYRGHAIGEQPHRRVPAHRGTVHIGWWYRQRADRHEHLPGHGQGLPGRGQHDPRSG